MAATNAQRFAVFVYRYRLYLAAAAVLFVGSVVFVGAGRVVELTRGVEALQETPSPGVPLPRVFDARYDIWFDQEDAGLRTYQRVEEQFIAEDTVLLAFSEDEHPWGIFSPKALSTIARLTDSIEQVSYVRHVRSLTRSPWVRWGQAGADEQGVVISDLFENDPASYSEDEILERMVAVLGAARAADLVGEQRVRSVIGANANFDDHIGEPRLLRRVVSEDGRSAALQIQVLRDKVEADVLVEAFGDNEAGLQIGPSMHANESQWLALDEIDALAANDPAGYEFYSAGMPVLEKTFLEVGLSDLKWVLLMFAVLALVLFLVFRSASGVFLPLLVVMTVIMGMLGTVLTKGDLLNNLTALTPNVIVSVGIADAVHLIAAYSVLRPYHTERHALIVDVLTRNAVPVFLTSVTTAVGFFSLMSSDILPMKMLGYTAGIGTLFAYMISMTIVPALLSLLPMKANPQAVEPTKQETKPNTHWSDRLAPWVVRKRLAIVVGCAVATGISVFGLTQIEISTDLPRMFPSSHDIRVHTEWIEDRLSGTGDLEIILAAPSSTEDPKAIADRQERLEELVVAEFQARELGQSLPAGDASELSSLRELEAAHQRLRIGVQHAFLSEVDRLEQRVSQLSKDEGSPLRIISNVESPLDVLRKMNQINNRNEAAHYRVPGPQDVPEAARKAVIEVDPITEEALIIPAQTASSLASQYYLQYENGAKPGENLSRVLSADRHSFRLSVAIDQAPSRHQKQAFVAIAKLINEEFPLLAGQDDEALAATTLTGKSYLFANMLQRFTMTMLTSLSIALFLITLLIAGVYRSLRLAAISLVPNVLPLVLPIGVMGFLGIRIDGPAVFVMAVALGVCVDDTIHFFTKFTQAQRSGKNMVDSLREVFLQVGKALTATTVILMFGFSVLMLSEFRANAMVGYLAAVMVGLAWVADFVVTPALLSLFYGSDKSESEVGTFA